MGIEIIKLGEDATEKATQMTPEDLGKVSFNNYLFPNPAMSIWMMNLSRQKAAFPWWSYKSAGPGDDFETLGKTWSVASPQHMFDYLFLSQLHQLGGQNLYVIFPGNVKTNGWGQLQDRDRDVYRRGQGCVYHLEGTYAQKFNINWVPFYQPQSLVREPNFESMWRLFLAKQDENEETNCLSYFSLANPRLLPEVVNLLIKQDTQRSEKLSALVDWFGVYSSPLRTNYSTTNIIYTRKAALVRLFREFERKFEEKFIQAQTTLLEKTTPRTAIRLLTKNAIL